MAYTSVMRMLNMNSGWDTEKLVTQMMQAESIKLNKMQKSAMLISLRQEMYRSVYSDLKNFQKSFLDVMSVGSMRMSGTFSKQSVSIKNGAGQDSGAVSVGAGAQIGKYSVKVHQLAAADLYESASKIGGGIKSAQGFEFDSANVKAGASYEITLDGLKRKISFNEGDAVAGGTLTFATDTGAIGIKDRNGIVTKLDEEQFIDVFNQKLKTAFGMEGTGGKQKIEAKLMASGGISISTNGYHSGFSIADGSYIFSSAVAEENSALADGLAAAGQELKFTVKAGNAATYINVSVTAGMTQQELVDSLNSTLSEKGLGSKLSFNIDGLTGKITATNYAATEKVAISNQSGSDGSMAYLGFSGEAVELSPASSLSALGITSGSASQFSANRTLSEIFGDSLTNETSFTLNGRTFSFTQNTKLSDLADQVNKAGLGVTMRYNEFNGKFELESSSTGYANKIEFSGALLTDNLGFGTTAKREAADSVATINGVTLTRATNEYEFLGVSWTLNKTTGDDELTVTVAKDADNIVEKIKSFVEGYNALVDKLRDLTNTSRPKYKGSYYDPLTDEEKAEMKDKDIELWDAKSKEGLLYRDSILTGITSQMRTALNQSVQLEDGSKISLYSLGITTGNDWTQGGKLEIDENKLRKAIEVYGEDIGTLFTKTSAEGGKGLAEKINDIIETAVSKNGSIARKAGIVGTETVYNNLLYNQLKSYNNRINTMLEKLAAKETAYYNMFARMEAAMSKANSQSQYIQSMFGGS